MPSVTDLKRLWLLQQLGLDPSANLSIADLEARLYDRSNSVLASPKTMLTDWDIYVYGNSYGLLSFPTFSSGNHYLTKVKELLGANSVTSYAISAKRALDFLSGLINQVTLPGLAVSPVAGSKWPGTNSRKGLIVVDSFLNDAGHYPAMNVTPVVPAALTATYTNAMKKAYRSIFAILSSEVRIEASSFTVSGTWTRNSGAAYTSGGLVDFTSSAGAWCQVSVTPPQRGPLAGKVFFHMYNLASAAGTMAALNVTVDGGAPVAYAPSPWETYVGPTGATVSLGCETIPIEVPIDGAAHTVRITHAGSAGHWLYNDFLSIPSETPNLICLMGCDTGVTVGSIWNAAQVAQMNANIANLGESLKTIVDEFDNVIYVESTMDKEGLHSVDGVHLDDLGMTQKANDLIHALQDFKPFFDAEVLSDASYLIT